MKGEEITHL
jgi:hypothetical protein